jgi:hypothetical protein
MPTRLRFVNRLISFLFVSICFGIVSKQTLIHVPHSWSVLKNESTIALLFQAYTSGPADSCSVLALQCINQLLALESSFFSDPEERSRYVQSIVTGLIRILDADLHFSVQANVHAFGNILSTLALHHRLATLISFPEFSHFVSQVSNLTSRVFFGFEMEQYDNCVHFLLMFWSDIAKVARTCTGFVSCLRWEWESFVCLSRLWVELCSHMAATHAHSFRCTGFVIITRVLVCGRTCDSCWSNGSVVAVCRQNQHRYHCAALTHMFSW